MADRRQVLRAILLGAAGLAVPASCGLPSGGHPIVDGPGPAPGGAGDGLPKAPAPADATDPAGLVQNFLATVAGRLHSDADLAAADERAQRFLTPRAKTAWDSSHVNGITVVRVESGFPVTIGSGGLPSVTVTLRPTGLLGLDGTVGPLTGGTTSTPRQMTFTVVPAQVAGQASGYLIDKIEATEGDPLNGMMLDSARLDGRSFIPQLIYYWSSDKAGLVPDLRYVPATGVSREIQYTDIVDWVLAGPSPLLHDNVQANLYDGNSVVGPNLTAPDKDGLVVNLTIPPPAASLSPKQVLAQLRWSLQPLYSDTVRLQVNSQPVQASLSESDFRSYNLADKDSRREDSTEYCVAGGVVRPVSNPTNVPAVLSADAAVNKDVVMAALNRDLNCAALLKTDKSARQLWVVDGRGSGKPVSTRVTVNGQPLSGQQWSRPAFLPMPGSPRVLVAVDNRLYLVNLPSGQAFPQPGTLPPVSDFAVAPDGKRIALISNRSAAVYGLQIADIGLTLAGPGRMIDTGLVECSHIAWSRLERVVVGGRLPAGTYQLIEATVDGAIATAWSPTFAEQILSVAALPAPASAPNSPEIALVHIGNGASKVGPSSSNTLQFSGDLPSSSPSPGGAAGGGLGNPTYPFYVD